MNPKVRKWMARKFNECLGAAIFLPAIFLPWFFGLKGVRGLEASGHGQVLPSIAPLGIAFLLLRQSAEQRVDELVALGQVDAG
jgi:hypothetical protein